MRFRGWMHADGYAGFEDLYRSGVIREVACMAHVRRKFVDIHRSQGSPIAEEAIGRIAQLYVVEKEARGLPPDRRAQRSDRTLTDDTTWQNHRLPPHARPAAGRQTCTKGQEYMARGLHPLSGPPLRLGRSA